MNKKNILIICILLAIIAVVGIAKKPNNEEVSDEPSFSFTDEDLEKLDIQISELEFEDLEGLNASETLDFSINDLNNLEDSLESLSFEDLEGLQEN